VFGTTSGKSDLFIIGALGRGSDLNLTDLNINSWTLNPWSSRDSTYKLLSCS
jgi:hypothetical protein